MDLNHCTMKCKSSLCHCSHTCALLLSAIKHKRVDLIRQNNSIDLNTEASQLPCDQSISFPLPSPSVLAFFLALSLLFSPSQAESIQGHTNVFLEGDQTPGGPASQTSSETKTGGGGGEEGGGRRASVTSVESETSICSMGQLGNTIANSEWKESYTILSHLFNYLL